MLKNQFMKYILFAIFLFAFVSCQNSNTTEQANMDANKLNKTDSSSAYGYWQIPTKSRYVKMNDNMLSNGNHLFYYDGENIILSLLTLKVWMWKSEDDFYKLKTKWRQDSLFYLPPFGTWVYLAQFNGTTFSKTLQDSVIFEYKKIKSDEISKIDSAILKTRNPHNYSTKATDKIK